MNDLRLTVRKATYADLNNIYSIEKVSFSSPWSPQAIESEIISQPWSKFLIALFNENLVGYINYWRIAGECHLLNIATHPDYRKKGIAKQLMQLIINDAQADNSIILLELRKSNKAAYHLYKTLGFVETGTRPRYYRDNGEDAILMQLFSNSPV